MSISIGRTSIYKSRNRHEARHILTHTIRLYIHTIQVRFYLCYLHTSSLFLLLFLLTIYNSSLFHFLSPSLYLPISFSLSWFSLNFSIAIDAIVFMCHPSLSRHPPPLPCCISCQARDQPRQCPLLKEHLFSTPPKFFSSKKR